MGKVKTLHMRHCNGCSESLYRLATMLTCNHGFTFVPPRIHTIPYTNVLCAWGKGSRSLPSIRRDRDPCARLLLGCIVARGVVGVRQVDVPPGCLLGATESTIAALFF